MFSPGNLSFSRIELNIIQLRSTQGSNVTPSSPQLSQVYFISTMFARSLNMPAHCGMEPFRQSWHFHLKSCKLVLPERSCGHRGEHQSNNFWKLLTGPPFAGDVPLQALVFSNSLSMHQTLYHHSLSTFSPFFLPAPPATDANHSR